MAAYDNNQIEELSERFDELMSRSDTVLENYIGYAYRTSDGAAYGRTGFGRRLSTMRKCINYIFDVIPLDQEEAPDKEELDRAAIYLQAFVLNAFGCTDCLAWVWLYEKNVRRLDGSEVPRGQVGLKAGQFLRQKLPAALQDHMVNIDNWFTMLTDVRDALMHRIPLYVPPYFVTPENVPAYNTLARRMEQAMQHRDLADYGRLESDQARLTHFVPLMIHTADVQAPLRQAPFHIQILNDLFTIVDLGERFMAELQPAMIG